VSDGVALLAILARVRRRLRAIAALEAGVAAGALALAALAIGVALARWRLGALPPPATLARLVAGALVVATLGTLWGAVRRIPLERCARIVDRTLGGHDRALSALAFHRLPGGAAQLTPFMTAAIADAVARGAACAPGAVAPLRRPRAVPALAMAMLLVGGAVLLPVPARGSRAPAGAATAPVARAVAARLRMNGGALDAEREQIAAALRSAGALGDPELAALARELAAVVNDLAGQGLERGAALDRLAELQRRSQQAAADLAALRQGMDEAGRALQAAAATRESGRAVEAGDGERTAKAFDDLAALAAAAGAGQREQIARAIDSAGDRAQAAGGEPAPDGRPTSMSGSPAPAPVAGATPQEDSASLTPGPEPGAPDDAPGEEPHRRLSRANNQPRAASTAAGATATAPRATSPRRLERLQRELRETASACRADPDSCRRKLERQASELPRMEDETRSLSQRQRLAEAVRQLRDRLRREGNNSGEHGREERRFMRAARGDGAPGGQRRGQQDGDREARIAGQEQEEDSDGDAMSAEGDDRDGDDDGDGDGSAAGEGPAQAGGGDEGGGDPMAAGQQGGPGDGIGNQKGDAPLGAQGSLTTRGHAREAQVRNGAGPTRAQVIQSAARRGFARSPYQSVYTDYQSAVEESLDSGAVPPGRRYIVRRYFQLIRPQSSRPTR
jgi:hypothetical protein